MPNKLVSETIDERILRLLGLEEVFDLDYDTYMTLLKEAMVKGSFGGSKIPDEELAILANERKRVRGKTGRFKAKKQKITADKVATTKLLRGTKKTALLPPAVSTDKSVGILEPLQSISSTLLNLLKLRKKSGEDERKDKERDRRTKREEGLEGFKKGISAVGSAARKMLAPFQSIIDRIWRFIFFTLLGRAFTQLMNWFSDPKNSAKIKVLGRFLKDWWPTLLGAAVLFFTPFGKFVRTVLRVVASFALKLPGAIKNIASAIKGLGSFAAANPLLTIGAVTGVSAAAGYLAERKRTEEIARRQGTTIPARGKEKGFLETIGEGFKSVGQLGASGIGVYNSGGIVLPRFSAGGLSDISFATGYDGIDGNTGNKVSGFGPDTQQIIARPGEVVINKETVDAIGPDYFLKLNRMYGGPGANKPKMAKLYNTGGVVETFNSGGIVGGLGRFLPGTGTVLAPRGEQWQGQGTVLDKILGITIPGSQRYKTYSQSDIDRFNQFSNLRQLVPSQRMYNGPYGTYMSPTTKTVPKKGTFLQDAFRNFGSNIKTIKNSARRQEEIMRQYGYKPSGYTNLLGQPIRRQGGGKIFNPFRKLIGGGMIKENTGMDIPGATADRQLVNLAVQPGESHYIFSKIATERGAPEIAQIIEAKLNPQSTAAKIGKRSVNIPKINPLSRSRGGVMTLPAITQSAMGNSMASGGMVTKQVPAFSAVSPSGMQERSINADIYGIVG